MNEFVSDARCASLCHFLSLNAIAWTSRREVAFGECLSQYRDGYRAAREDLIADGCIDVPRVGFLRLTEPGYREALDWACET